eukprot:6088442-Lingulodinium_polyedra.AAC.1
MRAWAERQDQAAAGPGSRSGLYIQAAALVLQAIVGRAPEGLVQSLGHWGRLHIEGGIRRPVFALAMEHGDGVL